MNTVFGSPHGVTIDFANDRITGLRVGRVKRRITFAESFGDDRIIQPLQPGANSLETETGSFSGALVEAMSARQAFAGGAREITIRSVLDTGRFNATVSSGRRIASQIRFAFELASPVTWTLSLDEPARVLARSNASVHLALRGATSLVLQSSQGAMRIIEARGDSDHSACSFELASGKTEITLDLEVGAWANISDTVVLCRPDQMREAAMVLAAVPDRRFVPLMVLEPPPMSLAALAEIFNEYRAQVTKTLGEFGAFGSAEFERKTAEEARQYFNEWAGRRARQEQMQPHRSWAKRNTMFRRTLRDFGITKAVCLFKPVAEDLVLSGVEYAMMEMPPGEIDWSRVEGLLDGISRIELKSCSSAWLDLAASRAEWQEELFEECCAVFGTQPGIDPLEASDDDPAAVILGLYEARRQGRPLRIAPGGGDVSQSATRIARAPSADHVVALEVHDHAQSLIASLYAAEIGATFALTPAPDLTKTGRIVRDLQAAVVERAQRSVIASVMAPFDDSASSAASTHPDDPESPAVPADSTDTSSEETKSMPAWADGFADALRQFVRSDRRPELLKALEAEVSRCIAPELVTAVGSGALTVFGGGLPYSFFRSGAVDWSAKRIGHVISDADLLVMSEFHHDGAIDPIVSFNLIVDPGFFENSETDVVAEALEGRPAKSLVLRKDSQIPNIFLPLLQSVPLDFIFFNTHGTDQSIMLGYHPLRNYQITQWYEFDERPLIFNNSCLSWTGVGRDFVRVGARGYVGTLWSVGVSAAADIARRSMARMINDEEPICSAIRQTEVDPFTSRAYIFVGTANASFSMDDAAAVADDPVRLVAVMQNYLHVLSTVRSNISARGPDAFTAHLYTEFKALREALVGLNERYLQPVVLDAMIAELELLRDKDDALNAGVEYRAALAEQCLAMLPDTPLDERHHDLRIAQVMLLRAQINLQQGNFAQADADAQLNIETSEKLGLSSQAAKQVRIQIAIDQNQLDQAHDLVDQTRMASEQEKGEPEFDLANLGRLCQLLKRDPARRDEGIAVAKQGIAMAIRLKNLHEQATFEIDLAQIYIEKGEGQNALDAAIRGLNLARRANAAVGELSAYGTIGQAYLVLEDLQNARTYAALGLKRAHVLNEPRRAATFLADLACIEEMDRHFAEALDYWSNSLETAAPLASLDMWTASTRRGATLSVEVANAEWCARYVCTAITSLRLMRVELVDSAAVVLFHILREFYTTWPAPTRLAMFEAAARTGAAEIEVSEHHPRVTMHLHFLFATCEIFHLLESGHAEAAGHLATHVDRMLGANGRYVEAIKQTLSANE